MSVHCKTCGKKISDRVIRCFHCGADQRNFLGKHKIIVGILAIIIISGIGSAKGAWGKFIVTKALAASTQTPIIQLVDKSKPVELSKERVSSEVKIVVTSFTAKDSIGGSETNITKPQGVRVIQARQDKNIAPKPLEVTKRNTFLRGVERNDNPRNIAIVKLLLRTGIRVTELVALNRADVVTGERSGSITVRNGKGNVSRHVPLSTEARLYLTKYLETRDDHAPALFLSNYRQRISVRTVRHILSNYRVHCV